jgi:hypothetical protein
MDRWPRAQEARNPGARRALERESAHESEAQQAIEQAQVRIGLEIVDAATPDLQNIWCRRGPSRELPHIGARARHGRAIRGRETRLHHATNEVGTESTQVRSECARVGFGDGCRFGGDGRGGGGGGGGCGGAVVARDTETSDATAAAAAASDSLRRRKRTENRRPRYRNRYG